MSVQSFSFSSKSVIIPSYNSQPVLDLDNNNNTARPTSSDLKINKNIWNKFSLSEVEFWESLLLACHVFDSSDSTLNDIRSLITFGTRWLNFCTIFGHNDYLPSSKKIAKVGSKFCQTINRL